MFQETEQCVPYMGGKMASDKDSSIELGADSFGKLVRLYRRERKLSQQQLADVWGYTREYVSQIERGKRKLDRAQQVNRLAEILDIPTERLEAIGKGIPQRTTIAEKISEADNKLFQALLEPAQATVKLSWLVWRGDGDITAIDNLTALIGRLEEAMTSYRGAFRQPVQQLLAYAYEMMGKFAFDQLDYPKANGYFYDMHQLGEELNNPDIIALAMTHMGDILRKRGRYDSAIHCLMAAEPYAKAAEAFIGGKRWLTLARVHFEFGDETPFLKAIEKAQYIALQSRSTLDTKYNQFDLVEVLQEQAQGYTMLWKPQKALDIYKETDHLRPFRPLRDLGSYIIIKAQAHAFSGDIEQGVTLALNGLELAQRYYSTRHIARVQKMYNRLRTTPLGQHPRLRDLREALASTAREP
jgi:transcriptional regulator with XRE-family HTH domain